MQEDATIQVVQSDERTAVDVFTDILDQAQANEQCDDVAGCLAGALLGLRFGDEVVASTILEHLADFRIRDTAISVTTAERPDSQHLNRINDVLMNTGLEVWILPRQKHRERWQSEIDGMFQEASDRIVVTGLEIFLGQMISQLGEFKADGIRGLMAKLFDRYEKAWLPRAGSGGLRIVSAERQQD